MLSLEEKHRTKAPVNGGRNYNGPKVAPGEIVVLVKMLVTCDKTERPHGALLQFDTEFG